MFKSLLHTVCFWNERETYDKKRALSERAVWLLNNQILIQKIRRIQCSD